MFTKTELLEKGVPADAADEIISAFLDSETDPLLEMQKALKGDSDSDKEPEERSLFKAEEGDDEDDKKKDEDDEDYDEKYMKKHIKRYMKENKPTCQRMMKKSGWDSDDDDSPKEGKESKMKKAMDEIDMDSEGAIVEMTDLAPFLVSQTEFNDEMVKAISKLTEQVNYITEKTDKSFDLMQKAARLQVKQSEGLNEFLNVPQGRKGTISTGVMAKAVDTNKFTREDNTIIYSSLMKAVKSGDKDAGMVISAFESAGHDANRLNNDQKKYIQEIITKEAN